ncbi:MAG TPA: GTP pyrophosphokinase [Eubacteriaceae bacterium]|nr:GTP pyrophosphokinase [Eubacteriaceae bacterium]
MLTREEEVLVQQLCFQKLHMQYRGALREIETKLKVINDELTLTTSHANPIEYIKTRLKSPESIIQKMHHRDIPISLTNMQEEITDIAGARVVCSFNEDIYLIARTIAKQEDIRVITVKDYMKEPKENGYRSYHMIVELPIFLSEGKIMRPVEIQLRTIAMEFWASLEHKLKYKQEIKNSAYIISELKKCADAISNLDQDMQEIRNLIESEGK